MTTTTTIMFAFCSFVIVACITAVMSKPTTYDQKQTGDLNVEIELKDLRVIALLNSELLEDYTDYDYFYDYADFTIKPSGKPTTTSEPIINGTTEKNDVADSAEQSSSQNSTVSAFPDVANSITEDSSGQSSSQNSTVSTFPDVADSTTEESSNPSNGTTNSTSNTNGDDKSQLSEEKESAVVASSTAETVPALRSRKRCKSGYVPNGNGRCRRINQRWLSFLP